MPAARYREAFNNQTIGKYDNGVKKLVFVEDKEPMLGQIIMQMSLKQSLRHFGKRAEGGTMKEIKQQHKMRMFRPRYWRSLPRKTPWS